MLGFTSDLQWFAVRAVYCPLKWLQGPLLGTVAPPYGESHTGHGRSSVHKAEEGMPSSVNWPVMGGHTAHPAGVTLASGRPPNSLNAPEGSPGCHMPWVAPGLVL